jgi:hypothetical protein
MSRIEFAIDDWIGECRSGGSPDLVTLGRLSIEVANGSQRIPLTEVEDTRARTVRHHIYVPIYPLVRWLLVNWWRIRWESQRETPQWRLVHSMTSIGDGYVWPPVELSSDGDFIQVRMESEAAPDVASIRYLRSVIAEVPGPQYEASVRNLAAQVQQRLCGVGQPDQELRDLVEELDDERGDPRVCQNYRWQAQAGLDPGEASAGWLTSVATLSETTGAVAMNEVMAVLPELGGEPDRARDAVEAIRGAANQADLAWVPREPIGSGSELPWQRGARMAALVRRQLGLAAGEPLPTNVLESRMSLQLSSSSSVERGTLDGGFRIGAEGGATRFRLPTRRLETQRFYLSRLIACAVGSAPEEHLLPVTRSCTAMQKFQRSFAQELLCPWTALAQFADERGVDDDAVAAAAEHFKVSEMLIVTTLVNKGKLPRERLTQM